MHPDFPSLPPRLTNRFRLAAAASCWVAGWLVTLAATVYGYGLQIQSWAWLGFGAFGSTLLFLLMGEILKGMEQ